MNIDPSTPDREVLIRYMETSGVNQQKEAAAEMRKMQDEIEGQSTALIQQDEVIAILQEQRDWYKNQYERLVEWNGSLVLQIEELERKPSLISRIALWFKKGK